MAATRRPGFLFCLVPVCKLDFILALFLFRHAAGLTGTEAVMTNFYWLTCGCAVLLLLFVIVAGVH